MLPSAPRSRFEPYTNLPSGETWMSAVVQPSDSPTSGVTVPGQSTGSVLTEAIMSMPPVVASKLRARMRQEISQMQ